MIAVYKQGGKLDPTAATFYRQFACTQAYYDEHKDEIPDGTLVYITDDASDKYTQVLQQVYPVGSVYMNALNSTSPAELFGFGMWQKSTGRFLYGADGETNVAWRIAGRLFTSRYEEITEPMQGSEQSSTAIGNLRIVDGVSYSKSEGLWFEVLGFNAQEILLKADAITNTELIDALEEANDIEVTYVVFVVEGIQPGETGGNNTHTITQAEMPSHSHKTVATSVNALVYGQTPLSINTYIGGTTDMSGDRIAEIQAQGGNPYDGGAKVMLMWDNYIYDKYSNSFRWAKRARVVNPPGEWDTTATDGRKVHYRRTGREADNRDNLSAILEIDLSHYHNINHTHDGTVNFTGNLGSAYANIPANWDTGPRGSGVAFDNRPAYMAVTIWYRIA